MPRAVAPLVLRPVVETAFAAMPHSQGDDYVDGIPKPGEVIAGKYRVDRLLGVGGMGAVVAATHLGLGQTVAIKFLLAEVAQSANSVARFQREAQAAAMIQSDHVARVSDVGTLDSGTPYMVMEFLQGEDLSEALQRGALPVTFAVRCVLEAAEALAEAHQMGIVHRDLKPANLFLAQRPEGTARVKVLDFGISKMVTGPGANLTRTSALMGSPVYMAPEQMESAKNVDARSDIWALGTILFESLTGIIPFAGDTLPEICAKILTAEAPSLLQIWPDAPPGLAQAIARALQKKPEHRYQTLVEMADALVPYGDAEAAKSAAVVRRVLGAGGAPASVVGTGQHAALSGMTVAGRPPGPFTPTGVTTGAPTGSGPYLAQPMPAQGAMGASYAATASGMGSAPLMAVGTGPHAALAPPAAGSYPSQAAMVGTGPHAALAPPAAGSYPSQAAMVGSVAYAGAPAALGSQPSAMGTMGGHRPAGVGVGAAQAHGMPMPTGVTTAPPFSQTMGGTGPRRSRAGLVAVVVVGCLAVGVAGIALVVVRGADQTEAQAPAASGTVAGPASTETTAAVVPSTDATGAPTASAGVGASASGSSATPGAIPTASAGARPSGTAAGKGKIGGKRKGEDLFNGDK
jgi:tRNA A-37 threonylcarbamoyl transferase component Bud32